MSLLEDIEAIRNDKKLSPEEKKKQIKRLRRKARRSGKVDAPVTVKKEKAAAVTAGNLEELMKKVQEAFAEMPSLDWKKEPGYAFSMKQATQLGVMDPQVFIKKFKERWGYPPKTWAINNTKSWDPLLLFGPVPRASFTA